MHLVSRGAFGWEGVDLPLASLGSCAPSLLKYLVGRVVLSAVQIQILEGTIQFVSDFD